MPPARRIAGRLWWFTILVGVGCASPRFDVERDLLSLHYDHAPDKDDGHSVAADVTVLLSRFDQTWYDRHTIAVSGAYGLNSDTFNDSSDVVMDAAIGPGTWLDAHEDPAGVLEQLTARWRSTLESGGDVWVKEGGQSDLTAEVVRRLLLDMDTTKIKRRVHVVQHSGWNEMNTSPEALTYVQDMTDYHRIPDANLYLNRVGGYEPFETAATGHPQFGRVWRTAFAYHAPSERLDYSDTGELFYILELGEPSFDDFISTYLQP